MNEYSYIVDLGKAVTEKLRRQRGCHLIPLTKEKQTHCNSLVPKFINNSSQPSL